jgi:hypothetical protein
MVLSAMDSPRQHDVEQHHVRVQRPHQAQALVSVGRRRRLVARPAEDELERQDDVWLVLDDQHAPPCPRVDRLGHPALT